MRRDFSRKAGVHSGTGMGCQAPPLAAVVPAKAPVAAAASAQAAAHSAQAGDAGQGEAAAHGGEAEAAAAEAAAAGVAPTPEALQLEDAAKSLVVVPLQAVLALLGQSRDAVAVVALQPLLALLLHKTEVAKGRSWL